MIDVMFVLISGQPDANLFPIYDKKWNPRKIVMIHTNDSMIETAKFFKASFSKMKIVFDSPIVIENSSDLNEITQKVKSSLLTYLNNGKKVVFNITGGTKLMSLSLFELWRNYHSENFTSIYLDIKKDEVIEYKDILDDKYVFEKHKLSISKDLTPKNEFLESLFIAHGIEFKKTGPEFRNFPKNVKKSFINTVLEGDSRDNWLKNDLTKKLNKIFYEKMNGKKTVLSKADAKVLKDSLSDLKDYCTISEFPVDDTTKTKVKITCSEPAVEKFLNGGWLEQACYDICKEVAGKEYTALNSKIKRTLAKNDNDGSENELDVLFLYKNTLHVIEVKTQNFETKKDDPKSHLDKLARLGNDMGKKTKLCYVSYYDVTESVKRIANDKESLDSSRTRFHLICDNNANSKQKLSESLKAWIKGE